MPGHATVAKEEADRGSADPGSRAGPWVVLPPRRGAGPWGMFDSSVLTPLTVASGGCVFLVVHFRRRWFGGGAGNEKEQMPLTMNL